MEYSPDEAKVLRDGKFSKVHASEVVPGDIISVAVGDKIPADARVVSISSASFTIDQALLTGESQSVSKTTSVVKDDKAVKQDMINMLFSVRRIRRQRFAGELAFADLMFVDREPPSSTVKLSQSSPPPDPPPQSVTFINPSLLKSAKRLPSSKRSTTSVTSSPKSSL